MRQRIQGRIPIRKPKSQTVAAMGRHFVQNIVGLLIKRNFGFRKNDLYLLLQICVFPIHAVDAVKALVTVLYAKIDISACAVRCNSSTKGVINAFSALFIHAI